MITIYLTRAYLCGLSDPSAPLCALLCDPSDPVCDPSDPGDPLCDSLTPEPFLECLDDTRHFVPAKGYNVRCSLRIAIKGEWSERRAKSPVADCVGSRLSHG